MVSLYSYVFGCDGIYGQGALNQWYFIVLIWFDLVLSIAPSFNKILWPRRFDISKHGTNNFDMLLSALSAMLPNIRSIITSTQWHSQVFMSDSCVILTSDLMPFFKAKMINFECKWTEETMIRFLPTLST